MRVDKSSRSRSLTIQIAVSCIVGSVLIIAVLALFAANEDTAPINKPNNSPVQLTDNSSQINQLAFEMSVDGCKVVVEETDDHTRKLLYASEAIRNLAVLSYTEAFTKETPGYYQQAYDGCEAGMLQALMEWMKEIH